MFMSKAVPFVLLAALEAVCAAAWAADAKNGLGAPVGLGKPITESDIAPWNYTILPDGTGLPPGSGVAATGGKIFAQQCAACHGENGKGGQSPAVISDRPLVGMGIDATKTIKNFWGNPTTLFDYIRRAMPWPAPRTLSNDQVYALVAYLLAGNIIIPPDEAMNAQTLPKVHMPNAGNFIIRFPDRI
jgi:S-disulfanyl-L-cysteine oxidoreductase SoxD